MTTTPFPKYLEVKNRYCIGYFGSSKEKVKRLLEIRETLSHDFPELEIYLACADEMNSILENKKYIIYSSEMSAYKGKIAYYRELEENEDIEDLLIESKI